MANNESLKESPYQYKGKEDLNNLSEAGLEARAQRWVAWNAKMMTGDSFFIDCGFTPLDFFKKYRAECLRTWRSYKLVRGTCICKMFFSPNQISGASGVTWQCPEHGNMISGHEGLWLEPHPG